MKNFLNNLTRVTSGGDKVVPKEDQDEDNENVVGGETPITPYRSCTDVIWIIVLFVFLIPLGGLLIYCVRYGDIYRIINGYDRCGNVCGRITERVGIANNDPRFTCLGADMTKRKYLLVRGAGTRNGDNEININRECIESCARQPGYRVFFNRCMPTKSQEQVNTVYSKTGLSNFFQEVSEDLELVWRELIALFFISLALSVVLLLLLRFAVALVVWVMLGSIAIVCLVATAYLWSQWANEKDELADRYRYKPNLQQSNVEIMSVNSYLGYAIAASVVTIIILLLVLIMRKRVRLVVQLFKEAGKAIIDMPTLLIQPWITFIFIGVLIALWVYTALWIESSGMLTSENNVNFNYKKDGAMQFTRWYNLFAMFWLTQFVIAGQHMIVAGAVSVWYFTRKKSELENPVMLSTGRMLRYHLGTLSIGSLILAIVQFLRVILQAVYALTKGDEADGNKTLLNRIFSCCLYAFEKVIAYLNRNAYIEVSMRSCNFWEGGNRAFKIIGNNAMRVAAINSVGDFVLFMGKIAVTLSTLLIAVALFQEKDGIQHMWVPVTLASLFGYLVAHTFMTVYEMAIDTIFICFCEDCDLNDGVTKPYYMSRGLMRDSGGEIDKAILRHRTSIKLQQVLREFTDENAKFINGNTQTNGLTQTKIPKSTAFVIDP